MPCSSKSVQERLPSVSSLLNGRSKNEEWDVEFNEMMKEAERKIVKRKKKKKRKKVIRKNNLLMSYWLFKNNRYKNGENKTSATKNDGRDTRRTKKK